MSKTWIAAAVATAVVGGALGVLLAEQPTPLPAPLQAEDSLEQPPAVTPAALPERTQLPLSAQPKHSPGDLPTERVLWNADSLREEHAQGLTQYYTQINPQLLQDLQQGQVVSLALPGHAQVLRATLSQTRNTGDSAVWHGALGEDDDLESLTLVRGKLETHISVATRDGSLAIIIDNATGKTQITDENQLVLRADPNDHLHYDHQELAPLPPPSQG